jgi:serine/threonine protein kinase
VVALLSHGKRIDTYDVYSRERDCRCVVKLLRPDRREDQRVRDAVLLEAMLLRDLTHPHLVRGYEVHTEPAPAMVLETLSGATLAAVIDDGPLSLPDSAQLGLHLVSVLSYLHRQGWLHLDVKPSNIVVENGRATLIDLSLVGRPGRGRRGAGTRGYLAPEQALGENLSAATDVWGLGVTLVESLTGEMPHGDEATWDGRRRIPLLHRRAPGSLPPFHALPAAYDSLLRGCLARTPEDRPTLAEVRSCLSELV